MKYWSVMPIYVLTNLKYIFIGMLNAQAGTAATNYPKEIGKLKFGENNPMLWKSF